MLATILYGNRDIRFEEHSDPSIIKPTDAIIRLSATCICGSDLWPYRGMPPVKQPAAMGHEYCGIVEEVGRDVKTIKPGQFVIGSFCISDDTCAICQHGYQSRCVQGQFMSGAQAPLLRVPLADGTLVATPELPSADMLPSLLAVSDVLGTGWFAADAASVGPGSTVVVVGDGAVGLLGVLSAKQMGAERIIVMSGHATRQKLALEFGATDIVTERGDDALGQSELDEKIRLDGGFDPSNIAMIFALRGDNDQAFSWLNRGLDVRDPGVASIYEQPYLIPKLRSDPRLAALLKKLNLPTPDEVDARRASANASTSSSAASK